MPTQTNTMNAISIFVGEDVTLSLTLPHLTLSRATDYRVKWSGLEKASFWLLYLLDFPWVDRRRIMYMDGWIIHIECLSNIPQYNKVINI